MLTKAELDAIRAQAAKTLLLLDNIDELRKALVGANWIIGKLAPHEATAMMIRGYAPDAKDVETGKQYRAMIDKALGLEPERKEDANRS